MFRDRKKEILAVLNWNKTKFVPYGDLVDQDFSQFSITLIKNQDPYNQSVYNKTPGVGNVSENIETNKTFATPNRWSSSRKTSINWNLLPLFYRNPLANHLHWIKQGLKSWWAVASWDSKH